MYYEDDDLCKKVRKKNGSVIQVFEAKAKHSHGQSKVKNVLKRIYIRNYHFIYDELYYYFKINKHHGKYQNLKKKLLNYIVKMIINALIFGYDKSIYYFARIKAFYDFNKLIKNN